MDDARGWLYFWEVGYSVALPYKEGDDLTGVAANEARALRARSHMALVSQSGSLKAASNKD